MIDGGLGGDAARGIVDEHVFEQIETRLIEVSADFDRGVSNPLGERGLEVGIRRDTGPVFL